MSRLPDAPNARPDFVRRVLDRLHRAYGPVHPWRPENPVTCLIGTILAQATNDVLAERAYRALRKRFPSWAKVHAATQRQVEDAIRMCGLAAQKARAIKNFLAFLKQTRGRFSLHDLRRPGLDVDAALAELSSVDGIGIKTATITLMFGCHADLCAVDTHLQRILQRLRIAPPKASPDRACRILRPLFPPGRGVELHLQLIRFGRTVCKAQRPQCATCALRRICPSRAV
jgi:endonuclease III